MSKRSRNTATHPGQLSLFKLPLPGEDDFNARIEKIDRMQRQEETEAGAFHIKHRVEALITEGLKRCPLSREVVAARMSELVGECITVYMIDSWSCKEKERHRFPLEYLPAFVKITGEREMLRLVAGLSGCYLVESEDALLTELGRIGKQKEEIQKREKIVKQKLEQMGINENAKTRKF